MRGVPTSFQSRDLAREVGVPLAGADEIARVDVAIDGADQVVGADAVKGGGAAHAREKIVDAAADRLLLVVDSTKVADTLTHPVPLEVLPDARTTAAAAVRAVGGDPVLRDAERKDGPVVTDNGNLVLDCDFGRIDDPAGVSASLSSIAGAVEHGLFVGMADVIYVGTSDSVTVREAE